MKTYFLEGNVNEFSENVGDVGVDRGRNHGARGVRSGSYAVGGDVRLNAEKADRYRASGRSISKPPAGKGSGCFIKKGGCEHGESVRAISIW